MTTLYRTPNLVIDRHEWHAAVIKKYARVSLVYRWRPLSLRIHPWSTMAHWKGPRPKGFCDRFWMFRLHIRKAMLSERVRLDAIAALRGPETAAVVLNGESRRGTRADTILRVAA